MAKDLKVLIKADANSALKEMDGFIDSLSKMQKEVIKASNNVSNASTENSEYAALVDALDNSTRALIGRLEKESVILNQNGVSIKNLSKLYKKLEDVKKNLQLGVSNQDIEAIRQTSKWAGEVQNLIEKTKEQEERTRAESAALKEQGKIRQEALETWQKTVTKAKGYSDNIEYYKLVGDDVGLAKEKLSQYEDALRASISTNGVGAESTKKLADSYKKQAKELETLSKSAEKGKGRINNLLKSFISAQAIVWGVQTAFRIVVQSLKEMAESAAQAEETANLFNTTFERIQSTASKTAAGLSSSVGLAVSSAQEAIGIFGDMAIGYGETQTEALKFAETAAKATLDIISFKNISGDTTEIMQTFASGLAGNFENFRKYGIIVTQAEVKTRLQKKGLDKLTGSALQFAKIQETLNIVLDKSKNAQGDMVKTLDSTANLTRRVEEANKQLMESMGSDVNKILNPLKKAWLDIAENINKANSAQKLFEQGQKNINVYDIQGNSDDAKTFTNRYQGLISSYNVAQNSSYHGLSFYDGKNTKSLGDTDFFAEQAKQQWIALFTMFNADIKDLGDAYSKADEGLQAIIRSAYEIVEAGRKAEADQEKLNAGLESHSSSSLKFVDSISGISGVEFKDDYAVNIASLGENGAVSGNATLAIIQEQINTYLNKAIGDAISSLNGTSWQDYASPIDLALGDASKQEGLKAQAEAFRNLYENIYNAILTGSVTIEDGDEVLASIAASYSRVNEEIASIANEEENLRQYESTLASAEESLKKAQGQSGLEVLSEKDKDIAEINEQREKALATATDASQAERLNRTFDLWIKETERYYSELSRQAIQESKNENKEKTKFTYSNASIKDNEIQEAYNDAMYQGIGVWEDLEKKLLSYGMSTEELSHIETQAMNKIEKSAEDLVRGIQKTRWEDLAKGFFSSTGGEMFNLVQNATGNGTTGNIGFDIASQMAGLVAQLDLFARTASFLGDTVLPVLNAFLAPVTEMVGVLSESIQALLVEALDPFFAIFKTVFEGISDTIKAVLEPILGIVSALLQPIESILDPIAVLLMTIFQCLNPIFQLLQPIAALLEVVSVLFSTFSLIVEPFIPIITLVAEAFKGLGVVMTYITAIFKKVAGSIVTFFTGMYNKIVEVLKSINILGWRPFKNLSYYDDSKYQEWKNIDPNEEVTKYLEEIAGNTEGIYDTNLDIADNTSKTDISDFEKMKDAGVISAAEFEALVADKLGHKYDYKDSILDNASYIQNDRVSNKYVSFGNITISVDGSNVDVDELTRRIMKAISEAERNPTFDKAV